jgi:glucosamine-6-phosphate deaminase
LSIHIKIDGADCGEERIRNFAPTPERPFVLGLPTGSSPEIIYRYLAQAFKAGEVSFSNVITFNMVSFGSFWVFCRWR